MICVFGQQDYAERIIRYLEKMSSHSRNKVFPFPLSEQNPSEQVFDFSLHDEQLDKLEKTMPIIVAFGAKHQEEATQYVRERGFTDVRLFDASMDNTLKKSFFKNIFAGESRDFSLINEAKSVIVYMAKSIVDQPLKRAPTEEVSPHIVSIQVGATLTDKKIADITDDTGENISDRNHHFSETTALYWMWKNAEADYLGLCHYRRLWKDLDIIANNLQSGVVDVVLPLPTWVTPSVKEGHLKHYTPEVWETMMNILKRHSPKYYEFAQTTFEGNIFYASNMLIAKRHVLNHLCAWMFPIVMETEKIVGDLPDPYYNRYCGFCTEQLITLYFLYNEKNWRIAHAEKIFIE